MHAGKLKRLLLIEEPTYTLPPDAHPSGARLVSWSTLATVWGEIEPMTGNTFPYTSSTGATASHVVSIRYGPALKPGLRVNFDGMILPIIGWKDLDERKREIHLFCTLDASDTIS